MIFAFTVPLESGLAVDYDLLLTGELAKIRENGATSGVGLLATFAYDDLGRRVSLTRGNGTATTYAYDPASRLKTLTQDLGGSSADLNLGFTHNPAGQIATATRSHDLYAFAPAAGTRTETPNALNQLASVNGAARTHDARGNLTAEGTRTFAYSSENMLTGASGGVSLSYDPLLRLHQVSGAGVTKFGYDGLDLIAEYDGSNQLLRRHVHGPGADEPLVTYEGSGTANRRFLHADERGSIVASSDNAGAAVATNRYDEYGVPAATNSTRFQYTGQAWLPELGLYHYKARMYDPLAGRFLQADPIGYGDGMNSYAYVSGDPVNGRDPTGEACDADACVNGRRIPRLKSESRSGWPRNAGSGAQSGSRNGGDDSPEIIITAKPKPKRLPIDVAPLLNDTLVTYPLEVKLTDCSMRFLRRELGRRGLPWHHLPDVRFIDSMWGAGPIVDAARDNGNPAITRGNTVYVNRSKWDMMTNSQRAGVWSEIAHTSQNAISGSLDSNWFYGAIGSVMIGGDGWNDNIVETVAHRLGEELRAAWQAAGDKRC